MSSWFESKSRSQVVLGYPARDASFYLRSRCYIIDGMNWLGKNYFKLGILLVLVVLLYYAYVILVVPANQRQANVATCNTQGAVFSQEFQVESKDQNKNIISFVAPEYHYSEQRQACLSENGYIFPDHGGTGTYMVITNINSNEQILRSVQNIYEQTNPSEGVVTYDEFVKQAPAVMSN